MNRQATGSPLPDALARKIPVSLITGFLGSGKTTLIAKLVRHPEMNRAVVVINEIGEIGIDHDLVTMASENIALLANGCICCSVRTDLQETLRDLFAQRRSGLIPDFDRVIIETTGLADPAPVIQTLASDTLLAAQFRLDGVITLVDAVLGAGQIERQPEAVKQIVLADRLFITKSDLVAADQLVSLQGLIGALNPGAALKVCQHGELPPSELVGLGLASMRASAATLRFLGEVPKPPPTSPHAESEPQCAPYLGARLGRHDASIRTHSLRFSVPFQWSAFSAAIELLTVLRGPDLLRVKAIVNVEGRPVIVQGVQHLFHPPVELDRWPSADRDTRLVLITRDLDPQLVDRLLQNVGALVPSKPVS